MSRLLVLTACVLMAGCSSMQTVPVVNHNIVNGTTMSGGKAMFGCTALGEVQATTRSGQWFESARVSEAIANAEIQARAAGATNVVWKEEDMALGNTMARGQAYKCQ